jgi:DNA topoisomerase-1
VIVNNLDDLQNKYVNHPKTAYVKKAKGGKFGKKGGGGLSISDELKAVVGDTVSSRGDVTKKIWEYIKKHKLQDKKNKRLIVPDAKLAKVFGSKTPVDMMQLARVLGPHFT